MKKEIDLNEYFKMDRKYFSYFSSEKDILKEKSYWLGKTAEERWFAVEFLRKQWIEMNDLPTKMDRKYFDYKP